MSQSKWAHFNATPLSAAHYFVWRMKTMKTRRNELSHYLICAQRSSARFQLAHHIRRHGKLTSFLLPSPAQSTPQQQQKKTKPRHHWYGIFEPNLYARKSTTHNTPTLSSTFFSLVHCCIPRHSRNSRVLGLQRTCCTSRVVFERCGGFPAPFSVYTQNIWRKGIY